MIRTPADHTLLSGEAEENMLTGWTTFDLQTGNKVSPDGMKVLCLCPKFGESIENHAYTLYHLHTGDLVEQKVISASFKS